MNEAPKRYDIGIRHGTPIDGTGGRNDPSKSPFPETISWWSATSAGSDREIDASGRAAVSGFIMHDHRPACHVLNHAEDCA